MKKTLIAAAVAGALVAPGVVLAQAAAEPASPHTLTANINLTSDYLFRGISQTRGAPAIQGGIDYSHESGLYAGTFMSSVSWLNDIGYNSKSVEWDFYGGYKGSITEDIGFDVGILAYTYPGAGTPAGFASADTTEVYGELSWKWLSAKYSHVISPNFVGWWAPGKESRDSKYYELNAAYDLGDGWGISGHIGHQTVENWKSASYTDWNVGVSKDVGFGVVALTYSDTDAKTSCSSGPGAYCWNGYEAGKGRAFVSFSKSF